MSTMPCCTPERAWEWVQEIAEAAFTGDPDATRTLALVLVHYLDVRAKTAAPR